MADSGGSFVPFQNFWDFLRNKNDDEFENSFDETYGDPNRSDDDSARRGLTLILMAVVFLFLLVIFRYCCFWIIDYLIMCDHRRHNQGFIRHNLSRYCPYWFSPVAAHTSPEDGQGRSDDNDNYSNSSEGGGAELVERNASYVRRLVRKLTEEQKRSIFSAILDSRKATSADISEERRDKQLVDQQQQPRSIGSDSEDASATSNASSSIAVSDGGPLPTTLNGSVDNNHNCCPICIQDIKLGDQIYHCDHCHHLFHFECMLGWVGTGSTLCPYCRREIVSRKMLEQSYRNYKPGDQDPSDVV